MKNIIGTVFFDHKNIKGSVDFVEDIDAKIYDLKHEISFDVFLHVLLK